MRASRAKLVAVSTGAVASIFASFLSTVSSSLVLLALALVMALFAVKYIRTFVRSLLSPIYVSILALLSVSTYSAVMFSGLEFSLWQVLRSQVWTLIALPLSVTALRVSHVKLRAEDLIWWTDVVTGICVSSAVLVVFDSLLHTGFSPSYIRSAPRIYSIAGLLVPGALIYALISKKYQLSVSLIVLSVFTFGKAYFVLVLFSLMVALLNFVNFRAMVVRKGAAVLLLTISVASAAFLATQYDRVSEYLMRGDQSREKQMFQVLDAVNDVPLAYIYGLGIGTRIIDGNYLVAGAARFSDESNRLLQNSQYEVEIGYMHLLARFGVLGSFLLILYSGLNFRGDRGTFFVYCLLFMMGASFSGIAHIFSLFAFGWSIGAIRRERSRLKAEKEIQRLPGVR